MRTRERLQGGWDQGRAVSGELGGVREHDAGGHGSARARPTWHSLPFTKRAAVRRATAARHPPSWRGTQISHTPYRPAAARPTCRPTIRCNFPSVQHSSGNRAPQHSVHARVLPHSLSPPTPQELETGRRSFPAWAFDDLILACSADMPMSIRLVLCRPCQPLRASLTPPCAAHLP